MEAFSSRGRQVEREQSVRRHKDSILDKMEHMDGNARKRVSEFIMAMTEDHRQAFTKWLLNPDVEAQGIAEIIGKDLESARAWLMEVAQSIEKIFSEETPTNE